MRFILGDMLTDAGYNVVEAVDGYDGLELVKKLSLINHYRSFHARP